jgi:hypothetical protein
MPALDVDRSLRTSTGDSVPSGFVLQPQAKRPTTAIAANQVRKRREDQEKGTCIVSSGERERGTSS